MAKLDLNDLCPADATFELSTHVGKQFHLSPISLRVRAWMSQRFTQSELTDLFENRRLPQISEIAYFILKEKDVFPTLDAFQDAFVKQSDMTALLQAVLTTVGISEPVLKKLVDEAQAEKNLAAPPTGAESMTPSPPNMDTP